MMPFRVSHSPYLFRWMIVLVSLSGCTPSILTTFTLSYSGSSGTVGQVNQEMQVIPTLILSGATDASITNCQVQPGSTNASLFPSSLNINPNNCVISGAPLVFLNPTVFTVQLTNNQGHTATADLTLSVGIPNSNWA
jgi:hypothetical protein